jgi:predicted metal-dependent hydrolase
MAFDPYSDRMARDIRNSLSAALVNEITGNAHGSVATVAHDWLATAPDPVYQAYIEDRLALYRQAINEIKAGQALDPRYQAIYLWNLGLFFEMHELLETIWQKSRDPERSALKGLIQAAGVHVHRQRGRIDIAGSLAQRAEKHLRKGRKQLDFISNLDRLIEDLADPAERTPKLLPVR